jgi:gliding motility-associated-like protein
MKKLILSVLKSKKGYKLIARFKIGLVTCLFVLIGLTARPQSLSPACTGSSVRYGTTGEAGSTFNWSVTGGVIIANYGDSIDVLWGLTPGTYEVTVTEYTALGCSANPAISSIVVVAAPALSLGGNKDVCEGQTVTLTADSGFVSYVWDDGSTSNSLVTSTPGYHWVTATNEIGCIVRDTVYITDHNKPDVTITSSEVTISNKTFGLCADSVALTVTNATSLSGILWNNTNSGAIYYAKTANVKITVIGTSEYGCAGYDTVSVIVCNYKEDLNIPEAITPNGDGVNDDWKLEQITLKYPNATVEIFDRWGRQVFKSTGGYKENWNGTYKGNPLPMDSYYYIIDLKNGTSAITGNIAIIK